MSDHREEGEQREILDELRLRPELEQKLIELLVSESFAELERLGDGTGLTSIAMKGSLEGVRSQALSRPNSENSIRSHRGNILQRRKGDSRSHLTELKLVEGGDCEVNIKWCFYVSKAGGRVINIVGIEIVQ